MFSADDYRTMILEEARSPRHYGLLDPADFDHEEHNPLCGDRVHLTLRIDPEGVIREVGWEGAGCAVSQASTSMFSDQLVGMRLADARQITREVVLDLIGLPLLPNRQRCALLPLKVLLLGLRDTRGWEDVEDSIG